MSLKTYSFQVFYSQFWINPVPKGWGWRTACDFLGRGIRWNKEILGRLTSVKSAANIWSPSMSISVLSSAGLQKCFNTANTQDGFLSNDAGHMSISPRPSFISSLQFSLFTPPSIWEPITMLKPSHPNLGWVLHHIPTASPTHPSWQGSDPPPLCTPSCWWSTLKATHLHLPWTPIDLTKKSYRGRTPSSWTICAPSMASWEVQPLQLSDLFNLFTFLFPFPEGCYP